MKLIEYFAVFEKNRKNVIPESAEEILRFCMFLGLLNPDPTSDLLHHIRFFKFPNLKVQNTPVFAILGVILYTVRKFKKPEVIEQF